MLSKYIFTLYVIFFEKLAVVSICKHRKILHKNLCPIFLGRLIQGVAGSTVWIVGLTTVADTIGQESMGTVTGLGMSFVILGMISGLAVSGLLLEATGDYWATWCMLLIVLMIDLIASVVMIENPVKDYDAESADAETDALLPTDEESSQTLGNFGSLCCVNLAC